MTVMTMTMQVMVKGWGMVGKGGNIGVMVITVMVRTMTTDDDGNSMVRVMVRTATTDYDGDLMVIMMQIKVMVTDDGEDGDD